MLVTCFFIQISLAQAHEHFVDVRFLNESDFVQIFDSGVYSVNNSLEKSGLNTNFLNKDSRNAKTAITPYFYTVGNDVMITYNANDTGCLNNIIVTTESRNSINYERVVRKILEILGMTSNQAEWVWNNRNGNGNSWAAVDCLNVKRTFLIREGEDSENIVLAIIAVK